jgi:hypothetical protein
LWVFWVDDLQRCRAAGAEEKRWSATALSFLESVPEVSAKLQEANGKEIKSEEVVEQAKQAAVLVLVY